MCMISDVRKEGKGRNLNLLKILFSLREHAIKKPLKHLKWFPSQNFFLFLLPSYPENFSSYRKACSSLLIPSSIAKLSSKNYLLFFKLKNLKYNFLNFYNFIFKLFLSKNLKKILPPRKVFANLVGHSRGPQKPLLFPRKQLLYRMLLQ